ncbi:hypothetical protein HPB48_013799 [Haemaphysalis longicornis]|uniref:Reverse transcriptase domain-containing protein n=1 Tax=Haemaphysalis longicornis TaxID=44386 RepID=A0A9J6GWV4_HAELO|nr:hypothetical protein HPB48_013799 [Haemaphysalis longicornis]
MRSFPGDRAGFFKLGQGWSEYRLGPKGTPQVAVLSPLPFNLVMRDLSLVLGNIPGINHAMYPDNITIWSRSNSEAQTKEMLQTALEITEECFQDTGRKLSPGESVLFLYRSNRWGGAG